MPIKQELQEKFKQLELDTVSDSFGGRATPGRALTFAFKPIMEWLGEQINNLTPPLSTNLNALKNNMSDRCFKYTLNCLGRFAFCIELTNLNITSTKMKTRWVSGRIMKTRPGTFENHEGRFAPGEDQRSASFDVCYSILCQCASLLSNSNQHMALMEEFTNENKRGTPYEAVFTYIDNQLDPLHTENNIRLVNLDDARWLVFARPIIHPAMRFDATNNRTKCIDKIATKCYKTDRSQTGEVQTNRAKRWECLTIDFQHASLEECWSVERKLLSDLAYFDGFPDATRQLLINSELIGEQGLTLCPITLKPMVFNHLLGGGEHGESKSQVGHMLPLKAEGSHVGDNIQWISSDGNRIQGSLNIQETRQMLHDIFIRMGDHGLIEE